MSKQRCTDDLCAYQTVKMVAIRDRRLGLLKFFLLAVIAIYIIVYKVVYQCNYLKLEAPVGTVRFSLREPTALYNSTTNQPIMDPGSQKPVTCDTVKDYTPKGEDCKVTFKPVQDYGYCKQSPLNSNCKKDCYNCTYWDAIEAKNVQGKSVLITTHIQEVKQNRTLCSENPMAGQTCSRIWNNTKGPLDSYVAGIEDFTLLLDHAIATPTLGITATSRNMSGRLLIQENDTLCAVRGGFDDYRGTVSKNTAPCYVNPIQALGLDFFTMDDLLGSANIDLDGEASAGHSVRYYGSVVLLSITYYNHWPWVGTHGWTGRKHINYFYSVSLLPDSSYKFESTVYDLGLDQRWVKTKYGLRLVVLQQGSIGQFDFLTLLLTGTASLSLLAVATVLVDFLATNILADRKAYKDYKVQKTAAFNKKFGVDMIASTQPEPSNTVNTYEDDVPLISVRES
mmetsp:Transcript_26620/g.70020  ORF Transcript_26620/g.70020 Transcript_26620/m.70020 type:complete len:452 (+) Transcript_26620:196-1551(+)